MNTDTINRLVEYALLIEKLRELSESELEWLFPLLNKNVKTTLAILDAIASQEKTFEEIATEVGCSPVTVSQKLNALALGGMAIDLTETAALAPTGRPRKLARRNSRA